MSGDRSVILAVDIETTRGVFSNSLWEIGGAVVDVETGDVLSTFHAVNTDAPEPVWDFGTRQWFMQQNGEQRLLDLGHTPEVIAMFSDPAFKLNVTLPPIPHFTPAAANAWAEANCKAFGSEYDPVGPMTALGEYDQDALNLLLDEGDVYIERPSWHAEVKRFMQWYRAMHAAYRVCPITDYPDFDVALIGSALGAAGQPHLGFVDGVYNGGWFDSWTYMRQRHGHVACGMDESIEQAIARTLGYEHVKTGSHVAMTDALEMAQNFQRYLAALGEAPPKLRDRAPFEDVSELGTFLRRLMAPEHIEEVFGLDQDQ